MEMILSAKPLTSNQQVCHASKVACHPACHPIGPNRALRFSFCTSTGYGIVFRAKYHGSEVAVKVIQEAQVTPAAVSTKTKTTNSAGLGGRANASVALHKQNVHDAIELVASVSISHPNIVQVR